MLKIAIYLIISQIKALVESDRLSDCGDGYHLDYWSSGDRS